MLPKIKNCIDAIENGVSEYIFWMEEFHTACFLKSLRIRGIGTAIKNDVKKKRYYHGE